MDSTSRTKDLYSVGAPVLSLNALHTPHISDIINAISPTALHVIGNMSKISSKERLGVY